MKTRSHSVSVSAFGAALFCSAAWFAIWLTFFQPAPVRHVVLPQQPAVSLCPAKAAEIEPFSRPTLFALPAKQGFSGTFPETRMHMDLQLDHPQQPDFYLPRETAAKPSANKIQFVEPVSLPQAGQLSVPGTTQPAATPRPQPGIFLSLSPNLQSRADNIRLPEKIEPLPEFVRAQLKVEKDGTVSQCFFETPLENNTLDAAIRRLHFHPASTATDGWIEIRLIPEGGN